ncbi:MAG: tetratricopeptide repeat protein [Mediterranea sp.]|jgi:tetratricopeptide (TPR) repeat protein|nr:tetratricopeptide repeat protein [Mediterranea sp.]
MNNLRILPYLFVLSLLACHPEGASVKQGLDKAAQVIAQDPDTASIILESIRDGRMDERQRAEYRYYQACLASERTEAHDVAEEYFKQAIALATRAEDYELAVKACRRCSLYYQKRDNFDEALKMERKAYANLLLLDASRSQERTMLMSSGMLGVALLFVLLGTLWRRGQRARLRLLALRCDHLQEKYQSLQSQVYEQSAVVAKVRRFKEPDALAPGKQPTFTENDWNELLRLQESLFGFVSKLKALGPKLSEEDVRVCAFLREGVQPACFSGLLKLTPETLTRRISRIKTEKLTLEAGAKESLEEVVKAL